MKRTMLIRGFWARFFIGLVFLTVLGANPGPVNIAPTLPIQPSSTVRVDRNGVSAGEIVIQGVVNKNGACNIGPFEVSSSSPNDGKNRWLAITINPRCQAIVAAKWDGALAEGPSVVTAPLMRLLTKLSNPIPEEPQPNMLNAYSVLSANFISGATRTSSQQIYMYGYGGAGDKLTKKNGSLTWIYDGLQAQITSQSGTCQGSNHGSWSWVVDYCATIALQSGPAATVFRTGQGNYHCSPTGQLPCSLGGGYYHSLYDHEEGQKSGSSTCTYSSSGTIVLGIGQTILQGCN